MKRTNLLRLSLAFVLLALLGTTGAQSQVSNPDQLRAASQKQMNDGNWKVAYDGFRKLCLDTKTAPGAVSGDLTSAVQCLANLGRTNEVDELIEGTIAAHKENWRLLATAAQQYINLDHNGF